MKSAPAVENVTLASPDTKRTPTEIPTPKETTGLLGMSQVFWSQWVAEIWLPVTARPSLTKMRFGPS